jgi:putative effector of murein hydrolase LrgA (UPF0299 family)
MLKAGFIALAAFGVIALAWHVGFLTATAFTIAGGSVSWGLLLLLVVLLVGIIKIKMR